MAEVVEHEQVRFSYMPSSSFALHREIVAMLVFWSSRRTD